MVEGRMASALLFALVTCMDLFGHYHGVPSARRMYQDISHLLFGQLKRAISNAAAL